MKSISAIFLAVLLTAPVCGEPPVPHGEFDEREPYVAPLPRPYLDEPIGELLAVLKKDRSARQTKTVLDTILGLFEEEAPLEYIYNNHPKKAAISPAMLQALIEDLESIVLNDKRDEALRIHAIEVLSRLALRGEFHQSVIQNQPLVQKLLAVYGSRQTPDDLKAAIRGALKVFGDSALGPLAELFDSRDVYVRRQAAKALMEIDLASDVADGLVEKALADGDFLVQEDALKAAAQAGSRIGTKATEQVERIAAHVDWSPEGVRARTAALDALAELGPLSKAGRAALFSSLNHANGEVIPEAGLQSIAKLLSTGGYAGDPAELFAALQKFGIQDDFIKPAFDAMEQLARRHPPALSYIVQKLSDPEDLMRAYATKSISRLAAHRSEVPPEALKKIERALTDESEHVRALATRVLGAGTGTPLSETSQRRLKAALADPSEWVRGESMVALAQHRLEVPEEGFSRLAADAQKGGKGSRSVASALALMGSHGLADEKLSLLAQSILDRQASAPADLRQEANQDLAKAIAVLADRETSDGVLATLAILLDSDPEHLVPLLASHIRNGKKRNDTPGRLLGSLSQDNACRLLRGLDGMAVARRSFIQGLVDLSVEKGAFPANCLFDIGAAYRAIPRDIKRANLDLFLNTQTVVNFFAREAALEIPEAFPDVMRKVLKEGTSEARAGVLEVLLSTELSWKGISEDLVALASEKDQYDTMKALAIRLLPRAPKAEHKPAADFLHSTIEKASLEVARDSLRALGEIDPNSKRTLKLLLAHASDRESGSLKAIALGGISNGTTHLEQRTKALANAYSNSAELDDKAAAYMGMDRLVRLAISEKVDRAEFRTAFAPVAQLLTSSSRRIPNGRFRRPNRIGIFGAMESQGERRRMETLRLIHGYGSELRLHEPSFPGEEDMSPLERRVFEEFPMRNGFPRVPIVPMGEIPLLDDIPPKPEDFLRPPP